MALFCSRHKGFCGFVRSQWVLAVTKPNSSLFLVQRNNEESGNHVVPVVIFLKDNRNHVFLTVLDTASSRAASLIPVFLIPKPLLMALGKFKSRFPGSILPPQGISEGAVDSWDASIVPDTLYPYDTRGATLTFLVMQLWVSAYQRLCTSMLIHDSTSPTLVKNTFKSLTQIINLKSEYFGLVYKVTKKCTENTST